MLTKKSTQSTRKAVTGTWRTKKTLLHMFSTLDHRPSLSMGPSPILSDQLLLRKPWNPRKEGGSYSGGSKSSMLTCTRHSLGLQPFSPSRGPTINTSRHLMGFPLSQPFFHASSRTWDQVPLTVTTRYAVVRRFRDFRGSSVRFIRPRTLDGHHETH